MNNDYSNKLSHNHSRQMVSNDLQSAYKNEYETGFVITN